jgi:hypothetical protein
VIDHKTAARKPNQADVDASLQLLVYLEAMRHIYPGADLRFRIDCARKSKSRQFITIEALPREDDEQRLIELVRRADGLVSSGSFLPVDPMGAWRCGGCPVGHACTFRGG